MTDGTLITMLAGEAYDAFTRIARGDETITVKRDDTPEWVADLVQDAHGDLFPDDWRYETIHNALGFIYDNESEDASEFADRNVDTYSGARLKWLASHLSRPAYCDEAIAEFGDSSAAGDIIQAIGLGQYMESSEVFGSVLSSLQEHAESVLEDWVTEAFERGAEAARDRASFITDNYDTNENRRYKLEVIEGGEIDESFSQPDLSGEHADDPTPQSLAREITGRNDVDPDTQDALAEAFEEGVSETFADACVVELRRCIAEES